MGTPRSTCRAFRKALLARGIATSEVQMMIDGPRVYAHSTVDGLGRAVQARRAEVDAAIPVVAAQLGLRAEYSGWVVA